MNDPHRIAIVGFSTFERSNFDAFFRLSLRHTPGYAPAASPAEAEFVIADGDSAAAMAQLASSGRLAHALVIGSGVTDGAAARLPRPVNLMNIIKTLDQLVAGTRAAAGSSATPVAAPVAAPIAAPIAAAPLPLSRPTPPATASAHLPPPPPIAVPQRPSQPAAQPAQRAGMEHILVVDDSDIALRFMASTLERFGFMVHLARSGEEAIERTLQRHFAFVFMDVTMPGLDGFKTCKAIKRRRYEDDEHPPTIVMLTSRDTPMDKLRGTMAGCDAYLTKPMAEAELMQVIGDREVKRHDFVDTIKAPELGF